MRTDLRKGVHGFENRQAAAAEVFRLAVVLMVERGLRVVALVHDAVLIEARAVDVDVHACVAQESFTRASRLVLQGIELRSDAEVVREGERMGEAESRVWTEILATLDDLGTVPEGTNDLPI